MQPIPPLPELVARYKAEYLASPKGTNHLAAYPLERERVRKAFVDICKRADAGDDVTDLVLTQLLPHSASEFNKGRGAWTSTWAVITRDIRQWFEGAGWVKSPSAWKGIASAILSFLRKLEAGPDRQAIAASSARRSRSASAPVSSAPRSTAFGLTSTSS